MGRFELQLDETLRIVIVIVIECRDLLFCIESLHEQLHNDTSMTYSPAPPSKIIPTRFILRMDSCSLMSQIYWRMPEAEQQIWSRGMERISDPFSCRFDHTLRGKSFKLSWMSMFIVQWSVRWKFIQINFTNFFRSRRFPEGSFESISKRDQYFIFLSQWEIRRRRNNTSSRRQRFEVFRGDAWSKY